MDVSRKWALAAHRRALRGQKLYGSVTLATALVFAWTDNTEYKTAKELGEMADISEDTARRLLKPLVAIGRVLQKQEGRTIYYRMADSYAHKAVDMIFEPGTSPELTAG